MSAYTSYLSIFLYFSSIFMFLKMHVENLQHSFLLPTFKSGMKLIFSQHEGKRKNRFQVSNQQ